MNERSRQILPLLAALALAVVAPPGAGAQSAPVDMVGTWTALGLTDVTTHVSSSIPSAGGWEVVGTGGFDVGDGGTQWTCEAAELSSGALAFTCTAGIPATSACESTLTPVGGT